MPAPTLHSVKAIPAQGNAVVVDFAGMGTQNGDIRVVEFRSQATVTADLTPPSGFQRVGPEGTLPASDRFLGRFAKPITDIGAEPSSYTFTGIAGGGNSRIEAHAYLVRGVDLAHWNETGRKYQASAALPAGAALGVPYTVIATAGAEFTAGNSVIPNAIAGYTTLLISQTAGGATPAVLPNTDTSVSRTGLVTIYKQVESGSLTVDAITFTWPGTATDPKTSSWIVRGIAGTVPVGIPVKRENGAVAYLSYLDGAGVRRAPASIRLAKGDFTVANSLQVPGITMGHRGASGVSAQPEMSRKAYRYAATARRYRMLEFSANRTSEVKGFLGLHDADQNRTSQTTGLPNLSTLTMAQALTNFNSLNSGGAPVPYYKLVDFLTEFAGEQVVHVDPKFNTGGVQDFLDVLEPFKAHVVLKYVGVGVGPDALAIAAKARGFVTATYAYESDWASGALHASQQYWDIIGMQHDATTPVWSRTTEGAYPGIRSYGKPVLAHILQNQAQYNAVKAKIEEGGWVNPGAGRSWIAQVSGVDLVAPVA
ncbi:phosphoesterase [Microbacterium phage Pepe25]|nr:phosphoesterase [Microbacterium phage Pepe25]